jgi:hypothetical protein
MYRAAVTEDAGVSNAVQCRKSYNKISCLRLTFHVDDSRVRMDEMCTFARRVGSLEGLYTRRDPAGHPFALAVWGLVVAEADGMLQSAFQAGVLKLHAAAVLQARSVAFVEGFSGAASFFVFHVFGQVRPVVELVLQQRLDHGVQLLVGQRAFGMFPSVLPFLELCKVVLVEVVHCENGLAPLFLVEADCVGSLAVEQRPVPAQRDATLLQDLSQDVVACGVARDVLAEEVGAGEMLVLAKHPAKGHDLLEGAARHDKATAAMGKGGLLLLLGEHGRAKIVGGAWVEVGQEAVQVVVVDVCVELDEDEPLRLGAHVRGPLHHGQRLVLIEPPALGRRLVGHIAVLEAVVDVEVGVVELVFGAQVGEGVGDLEAVVCVFAVGEDEQVLLAAAQAVEVGGQSRGRLAGAYLEHYGHVVHDAVAEGRALAAIVDCLGRRPGKNGRGPLDQQLEAALAPEEGGNPGGEEEDAEHQRGAQQAQRRQSHHHGGAGAEADAVPEGWLGYMRDANDAMRCDAISCLGESGPAAPVWR